MADKYLGQITAGTSADGDHLLFNDISDTTLDATGTPKIQTKTDFLAGKVDTTTTVNGHALSANVSVTKADVGLGSADNTADTAKPVSTAQQTALDLKANISSLATVATSGSYADLSSKPTADTLLPTQTGNSGKYLTTNGTTSSWGSVAAGGGQTLVDKIVAPTGGDYTTLGAALAAASAGDTIFVRSGTYTEGAITSALANITIIGEGPESTVLSFGANTFTQSGNYLTLQNIKITTTTGKPDISGDYSWLSGCHFYQLNTTTDQFVLQFESAHGMMSNCIVISDNTYSGSTIQAYFSGAYQQISGSYIKVNPIGKGVQIAGTYSKADNCKFFRNTTGTGTLVNLSANNAAVTDSLFNDGSRVCTLLTVTGFSQIVDASMFLTADTAISCSSAGRSVINSCNLSSNAKGIRIVTFDCTVSGNNISGFSSATSGNDGIILPGSAVSNAITGNRVNGCNVGVNITGSSNTTNLVGMNHLLGNVTPLSDTGTSTTNASNVTA